MQLRWRTRMTSGSRKRGRTRLPYTSCQWSEPTGRAPIPRSSDRLEQGRLAETCRRTVTRTRPPRPCELRAAARTMRRVKPATRLVRPEGPGVSPPLDRSTTFAYREPRPAYYQRHGHPVGEQAERLLGELDGGHALLFPSGAGATTALALSQLRPGATIALAEGAYYGTGETFRPLEHGADFVLHSATKFLAGHSDVLLGAVVCADEGAADRLRRLRTRTGIVAAPDPAWLLLRGLRTLELRVRRQSASALELARRLAGHPRVERVRYPGLGDALAARWMDGGFGGLLSFDVAGDARAVEEATELIINATSLGGVESPLESRARWEGDRVPPNLLCLSVGLEDVEDLWADLANALERA